MAIQQNNNSKRHLIILLAAGIILMLCLGYAIISSSTACEEGKQPDRYIPITSERSTPDIYTKISIDYPQVGHAELQKGITTFIIGALTDTYTWGSNPRPSYHGDTTNGQAIADFFADDKVKEITDERRRDSMVMDAWDEQIAITKAYETDRYVTYEVNFSGSHGGVGDGTFYGVSFRKTDGQIIQIIRDADDEAFKLFICDRVRQQVDADAKELISTEDLTSHPIPRKAPYITDKGICFVYQKYEIGAGALGAVEMTVPFEEMADYMSEEALQLIHIKQ